MSSPPTRLTVFLLVDFPFPGETGSPLHCMSIARGLSNLGCKVIVVKYEGSSRDQYERDQWEGIEVHRIPRKFWVAAFRSLADKHDPDVLYAHGQLSALASASLGLRNNPPLVLEIHSALSMDRRGPKAKAFGLAQQIWLWIARPPVIALSTKDAERIAARRIAKRQRISVLYPPVDVDHLWRPPRAVRSKDPVVLYVGNFMPYQGIEMLLEAAPEVLRKCPTTQFRLVGGSIGELGIAYSSLNAELRERIDVVGRVKASEVSALYDDADVVVIPRPDVLINRTTARKLGEYLACGRVIVATDVGDHRQLLENSSAGVVCLPNSAALAQALVSAVLNEVPTEALAANAQRLALEVFSETSGSRARYDLLLQAASRPTR